MKKTLLTLIVSLSLAACVGHEKTPPIETYSLATATASIKQTSSQNKHIMRMMPASIAPEFSNYSFIYRTSNSRYLVDPYRQFLSSPNAEITSYLQNALAPTLQATLIASDNLMTANFVLQENITALYADYQNKSAPEAVMEIQFILYQCKGGTTSQISTLNLSERTPIAPNDPTSLIKAYQNDLDKMTGKLSVFINQQLKPLK